jgi:hypothetical protein
MVETTSKSQTGQGPDCRVPRRRRGAARLSKAQGFKVSIIIELIEASGVESQGMAICLGFVIELARSPLAGVIAATLGAWLHARYGRKVRLKIGDIEAEAQSEKQVQRLLEQAEEFQKRKSKVIEP